MTLRQLENNPTIWKFVFSVLVITFIASIFIVSSIIDYAFILSSIYLIPIFGLAFEKPIWSSNNWKILFWLACVGLAGTLILWVFAYFNSLVSFIIVQENQIFTRIIGVSMLLMLVILIRGLYLYSYQREYFWKK